MFTFSWNVYWCRNFKRVIRTVNDKIKFDNGKIDTSHLEMSNRFNGFIKNNGGYMCDECDTRHETGWIKIKIHIKVVKMKHPCRMDEVNRYRVQRVRFHSQNLFFISGKKESMHNVDQIVFTGKHQFESYDFRRLWFRSSQIIEKRRPLQNVLFQTWKTNHLDGIKRVDRFRFLQSRT